MPAHFSRVLFLNLIVLCAVILPTNARADDPTRSQAELERRVRELEETVRLLTADRQSHSPELDRREQPVVRPNAGQGLVQSGAACAVEPATASSAIDAQFSGGAPSITPGSTVPADGAASSFTAGWKDSFILQSRDKQFLLRLTGQIQADYRDFLDNDDTTDIDSFFVRRARLGIEATMFDHFEFRFLPDFGQGQARIQDAYLNVHYCDALQVEMGKFKQPFSYEQLIQDRFVPMIERSIIDQLVPARDVGFMLHGQKLFGGRLDWAVSVSNGEINGDADTNSNKDLAGRVAVRPFIDPDFGWLRGFQFGISGTTGNEQEPINPAKLRSPATVTWLQYNKAVIADGSRDRWSPELAYFCGPFGFATQYLHEDQEMRPNSVGAASRILVDVPTDGYYFMATYLITGEQRTSYSQAIEPLAPFDPHCPIAAPGAWELVARFSRARVGDEVFANGAAQLADPTRYSSAASELTLGFNWYLNRWVRAQFNWEHVWFDDPVQLGTGSRGLLDSQDTLMARFQVIF